LDYWFKQRRYADGLRFVEIIGANVVRFIIAIGGVASADLKTCPSHGKTVIRFVVEVLSGVVDVL